MLRRSLGYRAHTCAQPNASIGGVALAQGLHSNIEVHLQIQRGELLVRLQCLLSQYATLLRELLRRSASTPPGYRSAGHARRHRYGPGPRDLRLRRRPTSLQELSAEQLRAMTTRLLTELRHSQALNAKLTSVPQAAI